MFTKILLKVELVAALVLTAMAYARLGENKKGDESLKEALKIAPDNAAANFNMGLMKAGQVQIKQFEEGITITMANDILFPEGGWKIHRAAERQSTRSSWPSRAVRAWLLRDTDLRTIHPSALCLEYNTVLYKSRAFVSTGS
jgi:hypothetical protein